MTKRETAPKKVQMIDIARLAGVSPATVSRALNNSPLINEETRQRVVELAKTLNYSINIGAQNLRLGSNRTVGVVIPFNRNNRQHVSDPFFLGMLGSLADALTDRNLDMLLFRVDADNLYDLSTAYTTGRAGGIIVIGQWGHHDQLNELALRRIPFVVWGAQLPRQMYCSVGSDNVSGGRLATEHLIHQGRRKIAFFGDTSLPEVALRFQGFTEALEHHGLPLDSALVVNTPFTPDEARETVRAFLERKQPFDGIFAASDLIAMTSMGLLNERGYVIPDELSIVGYDDIEAASHCHPPLTTIKQPLFDGGSKLVDRLVQIMAGEAPESCLLPTELVVRHSSGKTVALAGR
jgi:DNA-binding LacI/PurR family transcriptional regulator